MLKNESLVREIPDGAVLVKSLNKNKFSYNIQINDNKLFVYHRTNGVTQYKVYNRAAERYGPVIITITLGS